MVNNDIRDAWRTLIHVMLYLNAEEANPRHSASYLRAHIRGIIREGTK